MACFNGMQDFQVLKRELLTVSQSHSSGLQNKVEVGDLFGELVINRVEGMEINERLFKKTMYSEKMMADYTLGNFNI